MPSFRFTTRHFIAQAFCLFLLSGFAFAQKDKDNKAKLTAPEAPEAPARTPFSDVRRESLLNGLQVITLQRPDELKVTCQLVSRSGSMFDLVGKTGLAKLTVESLLAVNPRLEQELESLDATLKWGVSPDTTWFDIEAPSVNMDQVLAILSRLLVVESVDKEAFEAAHTARLEKLKARQLAPAERADEAFRATLYGQHPYGHNSEGSVESISNINYGDVLDFYKRVYLANNMFAVVYGRLNHDRLMSLFRMFYGSWIKGVPPPPSFRPPQKTLEPRVQKVVVPDTPNVEIRGGLVGVSHTDADYIATRLVTEVLGNRLKKILPTATAQFPAGILQAPVYFKASVPADKAMEFSRQATDIFSTLDKSEISELELAMAQATLLQEHQARSVPDYLREISTFKLPETYPLTFESRVKALTTLDLQRVAKRLIEANALTVLVLGQVAEESKAPSE